MDVCTLIQQRLREMGLEQRDLAAAAQVTESYISQLLTRKKAPPAAERTDLYERMNAFLKLPQGRLSSLAQAQRHEEWKKKLGDPPAPLFREVRSFIIRKCRPERRTQIRQLFERQSFGEIERLVSQTVLDITQGIAREELIDEAWSREAAKNKRLSYEEMRAVILEFLDTDVFNVTIEHCSTFLEPIIESWDIDLETFALQVQLNKRLASNSRVCFQFARVEEEEDTAESTPGFQEFLRNQEMSGQATAAEIAFLRTLKLKGKLPNALYFYRELQNLRDPLNFCGHNSNRTPRTRNSSGRGKKLPLAEGKKGLRRRNQIVTSA